MLLLKYKSATPIPVVAECVTPDNLAGKSAAEVAALPVQHGNAPAPLGEFFAGEGSADDREIVLEGDCGRVKWVGAGGTATPPPRTASSSPSRVAPTTVNMSSRATAAG